MEQKEINQKGVYSGFMGRRLYDAIKFNKDKELLRAPQSTTKFENVDDGIIAIFQVGAGPNINELINWLTQNEIFDWTIGNYFNGKYKSNIGARFDETSLCVQINEKNSAKLDTIGTKLRKDFYQESVLVKEFSINTVWQSNITRAEEGKVFFAIIDAGHSANELQSQLKQLGLDFQEIIVSPKDLYKDSLLVWNVAYTYQQFEQVILHLKTNCQMVCIGKKLNEAYQIDIWRIDSGGNHERIETRTIDTAAAIMGASKFKFGERQINICAASSEGMAGYYARRQRIEELISN